jgi:hypothetical protein
LREELEESDAESGKLNASYVLILGGDELKKARLSSEIWGQVPRRGSIKDLASLLQSKLPRL